MHTPSLARPARARAHTLGSISLIATFLVIAAPPMAARAQAGASEAGKKVLTVPDYGRWRTINGEEISSDGQWVAWIYRYTNVPQDEARPELHILNVQSNADVVVPDVSSAHFSPDGRWIAYTVDSTPPKGRGARGGGQAGGSSGGRGGNAGATTHHRVELRELATGATHTWRDMQSAVFSNDSRFALIRDRAAAGGRGGRGGFGGRGGAEGAEPAATGSDAVLYDLSTDRGRLLGSVGDAAFNRAGTLLAYTVDATTRDGNGLYVVDLATGNTQALDNDARTYARLAWDDAGNALAVLKGVPVPKMRERDNTLLVVRDVRSAIGNPQYKAVTLSNTAAGFTAGWVLSERAPLSWSADDARVFFGAKAQVPAPDTSRAARSDTVADVDIWRTDDRYIQSEQMIRANRDRNRTYVQAFDVARDAFVPLSDSTMGSLEISTDGRWGVGQDDRAYISDWKPSAADFYRVDLATGQRTLMFRNQLTQGATFGISPDGKTFLYWKDAKFQAYNLAAGTSTTLGADAPNFVNTDFDYPGPKPSWGVAGYSADGKSVIVQDKYDLWTLPLDGKGSARDITGGYGRQNRVTLRLTRFAPMDSTAGRAERTGEVYDLGKPQSLAAFGDTTKQAGFFTLDGGRVTKLFLDDASYDTPARAAHADRYLYTRETFTQAPDLRLAGAALANARQITNSNPQQAEYRWGHSKLFDYVDRKGHKLQGMLWIPDDYQPGQKRPGLVTFYEKQSQNVYHYPMPELLVSMGRAAIEAVSRGYVVVVADVYYNTGSSHNDQLDCVEAATRKAIQLGYLDPKHIGLHGHSYGGEGAAYIGTKSRLFAAVGEGAGVTDTYTDFSQEWGWSYQVSGGSGQNGNQYYMYGQGRWGFSPWERPDVYHDESALTHVPEVTQPFLIMHGTADPTVNFIESLNFYNALRFNGKTAYLLAYIDAGHHVSTIGDRRDLTTRFFQYFDHYLMGTPAPDWMTKGVPFLKKAELMNPGPDSADGGH
ncbi:MAG TPA: prolyl oligopeptidase family serine peptidase [Gemmatimonadaceae bacterium]|nr:prolyl oligopeptidase family serine peptidase [Gemmatimonadaceae bacterium]